MDPEALRLLEIRELLAIHDAHRPPGALELCLFDGHLLTINPIYRAIRAEALRLGCRFTTEDDCHYRALHLASLDAILASGAIPYVDNVTVVRELERRRPGRFLFHHIFELTPSYVLHETAHVVADRVLAARIDTPRDRVLAMNLAESFANASELLARLSMAEDALDDRILDTHSHVRGRPPFAPVFHELADRHGRRTAAAIAILGYLYANFLVDAPTDAQIAAAVELASGRAPDAGVIALARPVFRACANLNLRFRTLTQTFYLIYNGVDAPLEELLAFDPIGAIRESPAWHAGFMRLVAVLDA